MRFPLEIIVSGRFLGQRLSGVQRVSREILCALDRLAGNEAGEPVSIRCVVPDRGAADAFHALGCRHVRLELAPGLNGHLWEQVILPRHVRDGHLVCLGNTAPLPSLLSRRPPAVMLHDQAHLLYPRDYSFAYRLLHRVVEAAIVRRAAPLLLVSEAERASLATRNPGAAARAVVAPNGSWIGSAPAAAEGPDQLEEKAGRYGLFIGAPSTRKNFEAVVSVAIRLAREQRLPFRFVGPKAEMLRSRVPAELRGLIRCSGHIPDAQVPQLYRQAAFLLYPSFYEASGLPPSEAMTFGCPVIVSDLPVMRERCGEAALYCDPADTDSIHRATKRVLGDAELAARLRRQGRERAADFTWESQARTILQAIRAVQSCAREPASERSDTILNVGGLSA